MNEKNITFYNFLILSACTEANSNKNCIGKDYKNGQIVFHRTLGNGTKYIGEWKDGLASGYGRMEWYFDTYTGEFKEGKLMVEGQWIGQHKLKKLVKKLMVTEHFTGRGSNYVGEWKNGKASGYGIYTWSKGEKYIGEHIDGKADGYGIILDQDGYKYIGEFKEKNRNGLGIYSMPSGTKYFGQWKNGKKMATVKNVFDGRIRKCL